jgi:hypothetical protein
MSDLDPSAPRIRPEAIDAYYRILEGAYGTSDFYSRMISLIQSDPYLFAPYLEMIDYLEVGKLQEERRSLLAFACAKAEQVLSDRMHLSEALQIWTKREGQILLDIIKKAEESGAKLPGGLFALRARRLCARLRQAPARSLQNLILIRKEPDLASIREEIAQNEICWIYNTARQDTIAVHKDTNAIVLRAMKNNDEGFVAIDGPHESERAPLARLFPHTIDFIERFAADLEGGLGRVALVRLKPRSMVYRHFDGEGWLKGRNRYHLVINSSSGSLMASGAEIKRFGEGDLFLFNNKAMHTAENNSSDWRTHAIFDMKVPEHGKD